MTINQSFLDRVESLARRMDVPWPLHDPDIGVGEVVFTPEHPSLENEPLTLPPIPSNLKSRLFVQHMLDDGQSVEITEEMRAVAHAFYGDELVRDTFAHPGKHPFIEGFVNPRYVTLSAKRNPFRMLRDSIVEAWERRGEPILKPGEGHHYLKAIRETVRLLDNGVLRVAEPAGEDWVTHQWLKQACLLYLRHHKSSLVPGFKGLSWDKVPLKGANWKMEDWEAAGFRLVPSAIVRHGAYVAPQVVLMAHSFVNMGARVDESTMIDTGARVGSCAQIGKRVHIGAGSGIGGVFEPLQGTPTIIGDDVFIGAMTEVAEGVIVGEGAVLGMHTSITASTKIVDRKTGEVHRGKVPPYSVIVPGSLPNPNGGPSLNCAVIVKTVDEQTRSKTSI
ncbi:MAG TPA: 2,3,4,5-tetrahydropyridine-2,6-dicarboxylate N-succinyltransferase, partial [Candidatus Paceibacterota bacterium]|nr:2,3,4,5-tetrahydropyridine-2,6-dicarboxylate N-succinyltransferase [Candidatus Paceibacterota bacterium]